MGRFYTVMMYTAVAEESIEPIDWGNVGEWLLKAGLFIAVAIVLPIMIGRRVRQAHPYLLLASGWLLSLALYGSTLFGIQDSSSQENDAEAIGLFWLLLSLAWTLVFAFQAVIGLRESRTMGWIWRGAYKAGDKAYIIAAAFYAACMYALNWMPGSSDLLSSPLVYASFFYLIMVIFFVTTDIMIGLRILKARSES